MFGLLISLILIQISQLEANESKRPKHDGILPVLVQQVCRHGDRSPVNLFPNNQHRDAWIQGPGYLTPEGEKMLYDNGAAFRSSWYPGLLSEIVYPNESYVVSSHIDRCIMSANSFMAALYPPTQQFQFEQGLNWQAFPTHMISAQIDFYLYGTDCPAGIEARERIYTSEAYLQFLGDNQLFINNTCQLAGYQESDWTINSLSTISDNLICDSAHNLSFPDWATESVVAEMTNILNVQRQFLYSDPEVNYLDTGGGPVLGLMVENIEKKMNGSLTQKFIYYSAHDTTVLPFLGIMEQDVGPNPPYSSCGVLELYQSNDNDFFVQLSFRNKTLDMTNDVRLMPKCNDVMCDYATFSQMVAPKVNMDPKTACYLTSKDKNLETNRKNLV
ncbi:testicular acid phosphatase homolog [Symsagittifera roscoffensis]|uniref:testicular acid phosphatase homolog n=1 Tax=Symsagittifera roscoffensis TaxID=84072 RepID=UPI00307CBE57